MGFGSTAKKVQKLADVAEKTYSRLNDLREDLNDLRGTVEETGDRVRRLERRVETQQALLEAIAEEHDLDVDAVLTESAIEDADALAAGADPEGDTESADDVSGAPADAGSEDGTDPDDTVAED